MNFDVETPVGERIRALRISMGMSQRDLAKGIMSSAGVSQIESGKNIPRSETVYLLAERLGVSADILLPRDMSQDFLFEMSKLRVLVESSNYADGFVVASRYSFDRLVGDNLYYVACARVMYYFCVAHDETTALLELDNAFSNAASQTLICAKLYQLHGHILRMKNDWLGAYLKYTLAHDHCVSVDMHGATFAEVSYHLGNACQMIGKLSEASVHLNRAMLYFDRVTDPRRAASAMYVLADANKDCSLMEKARSLYEHSNDIVMMSFCTQFLLVHDVAPRDLECAVSQLMDLARGFVDQLDHDRAVYMLCWALDVALKYSGGNLQYAWRVMDYLDDVSPFVSDGSAQLAFYLQKCAELYIAEGSLDTAKGFAYDAGELFKRLGMYRESRLCSKLAFDVVRQLGLHDEALSLAEQLFEDGGVFG